MINSAHFNGKAFVAALSREEQKRMGQFMTPPEIATFMARRLIENVDEPIVRVLEPAAGAGVLAAAVVQELLVRDRLPSKIELLMFELDERLVAGLAQLAREMHSACAARGVELDWQVRQEDFLLSELAVTGVSATRLLIISNPPYFKLTKNDPRAVAHSYAVYGQPNIYGLFMAACARLVTAGGKWCFITPRSWMSGNYFSAVRRTMFSHLCMDALHSFESRKDHFAEDAILQEAIITWASAVAQPEPRSQVIVTRSVGIADMEKAPVHAMPIAKLIGSGGSRMVALPVAGGGGHFDDWSDSLDTYGIKISTGPVVPFRALEYVRQFPSPGTVPLLWMQHVSTQGVVWPIQKKREHILAEAGSAWMLVRNAPMVLMRRFSPNESARRISITAYAGTLPGELIGLENHLNYIYRAGGGMSAAEALGLAAFFGSAIVDKKIRSTAGSTQVNAVDLRQMKLPPLVQILAIGNLLHFGSSLAEMDLAVERVLAAELVERQVA
ncbi:Eco57I restriction-modification methylase domain-containing protein [Massilia glaciei]|uniref:site-specific DNA-methyltransferase (adenine-specific) n=1 Tax=Massilia glaciei TaxID=1524097 RepID=A0A2U2HHF2_9BURK|nr:Eco57I restriction-modification methylase domain-containing protein [Massilia glaciei]PWF45068.1 SAM-dependent methyltransferase [Massilia glaciei]